MSKCELSHLTPRSPRILRSSEPLYLARTPKPELAYPTGEQSSMVWNPASASCLMVPGKSWPICVRTGYVWHPIGIPSGAAPSTRAPADINPVTAVLTAAFLKNSLLELVPMMVSIVSQFVSQSRSENSPNSPQLAQCVQSPYVALTAVAGGDALRPDVGCGHRERESDRSGDRAGRGALGGDPRRKHRSDFGLSRSKAAR